VTHKELRQLDVQTSSVIFQESYYCTDW